MGTTHGTEELDLCSHGLACQAGVWGRYIGFCSGYGHIWTIIKSEPSKIQNYSANLAQLQLPWTIDSKQYLF